MPKVLAASGPGFLDRLVNVWLLPAVRDERGAEESPTRIREESTTLDVREIQPSREASVIRADLDRHAANLDAIAGSEFVDDRIRLRE